MEIGFFFHFNIATFAEIQGCVMDQHIPDISLYNLQSINIDNWMEQAHAMGRKYAVFTVKHACGFLSWPSKIDLYG